MSNGVPSRSRLMKQVVARLAVVVSAYLIVLFLPAGTFAYWEAWLYLGILLLPMLVFLAYLLDHNPELLARRMRMREKEAEQSVIVKIGVICMLLELVIPGLDRRFGWSQVPAAAVVVADVVVVLGYAVVAWTLRENRYASRIVEVEAGQHVIDSGPYAIVRHPMYVGVLLMYLLTPVALGSWWAMIPAVGLVPVLVARIRGEEKVLASGLCGYVEYMRTIRYRLIPGVW